MKTGQAAVPLQAPTRRSAKSNSGWGRPHLFDARVRCCEHERRRTRSPSFESDTLRLFQDKEHLFTAICAEKRDRNISELVALLDTSRPVETVLTEIRQRDVDALIAALCHGRASSSSVWLNVCRRSGASFRSGAEANSHRARQGSSTIHVAAGRLHVPDSYLAAAQF